MQTTVAEKLARVCDARTRCDERGNSEWEQRHEQTICTIERNMLPSGSGFNAGTIVDREKSGLAKLVFHTSYHHMSDVGYYDGWTEHTVTVRPTFAGLDVTVSGKNRNDIKDFIADEFIAVLSRALGSGKGESRSW